MLIVCASIFFLSWCAISVSFTVLQICLARFTFGVGIGMNDITTSIYLGENFSPKLRAIFCSITLVAFYAAELMEFVIASLYSYRVVAAINGCIAFVGLLSMYFSVETTQHLLMKGETAKAEKNYLWLRSLSTTDGDIEFQKMKQNVEDECIKKVNYRKLLLMKANYRSIIITSVVCALTMASGGAAVVSYMTIMFASNEVLSLYQFTILFGFVRLVVSSTLPFYIEKLRRRTIVLGSFLLITSVHLCSAILYDVHMNVYPIKNFSWLIFSTLTLYACVFTILSPLNTMVRGELFPQSVRALGGFVAMSSHSTVGFVVSRTFLPIKDRYGLEINFLLYAAMSFVAFVYTFFQLPETRGRTLVEIQWFLER